MGGPWTAPPFTKYRLQHTNRAACVFPNDMCELFWWQAWQKTAGDYSTEGGWRSQWKRSHPSLCGCVIKYGQRSVTHRHYSCEPLHSQRAGTGVRSLCLRSISGHICVSTCVMHTQCSTEGTLWQLQWLQLFTPQAPHLERRLPGLAQCNGSIWNTHTHTHTQS